MAVVTNTPDNFMTKPNQANGVAPSSQPPGQAPSPPAQNAPNQQQGTSSGRFSNITNYLKANQGYNKNSGGFGGQIAQNINQRADATKGAIQGSQQNFQQQSQQNANAYGGPSLVGQATADPNAFTQDPNQVAKLTAQRDASYTGPTDLQNAQQLQGQSQNLTDLTNSAQTEGGRFNMLRTMFNRPSYSKGQQNLDNLLLQSNPQNLSAVQGTRQSAMDVNRNLNQAQTEAQTQAGNLTDQANQLRDTTRTGLNDAATGFNTDINNRVTQAQTQQNQQYNDALNNLKQGGLTQDQMSQLGLQAGTNLYGVDPSQYLNKGQQATAQTLASQQDYSKINALKNLIGGTAQGDVSGILSSFGDTSQAGTYDPTKAIGFDKDTLNSQIAGQKAAYENDINPINQSIGTLQNYLSHAAGGNLENAEQRAQWLQNIQGQGQQISQGQGEYGPDAQLLGAYQAMNKGQSSLADLRKKYNVDQTLKTLPGNALSATAGNKNISKYV